MSKRHATSRRRTYGRRQHELHERMDRRTDRLRADHASRALQGFGSESGFMETPTAEQPFGFID